MILDEKSLHECTADFGVPHGSIFEPTLLLHVNDLLDDGLSDIAIYTDGNTLYPKCDPAFDFWQQFKLSSELESDLRDTVDGGIKWLLNFNAMKTELVSFDSLNYSGAIDKNVGGSPQGLFFFLNWIGFLT